MPACPVCGVSFEAAPRFCPECGTQLGVQVSAREQRKTVTVLFCDLTGSTALGETIDPERLRALLARYFERMKAIVDHHGGRVEKFIGDAVMAVFGVPVLHEDDALRALRAAIDMRDALPELGLQGRIGVMTGEVVTGTSERLATGDAVNVAARLEQAAEPGEVLIGAPTLALAGEAAHVEPLEPLRLNGKADPVPAYRLLTVAIPAERRSATQFVGRRRELALIREAWARALADQRCELVTVIGDAGVGKSRLAAELLTPLDATVVRGRCLPYGDGITYWPVIEVLKQLDLMPKDMAAAVAIRSVLGDSESATSSEEIAWAFRKTLEQAAAERPLVVAFDDIQWGEETFLDLIEHLALLSTGVPILVLCLARPELSERRAGWPVTLRLEPLGGQEVEELLPERISGELRTKVMRAAGGNPLFIEEMLAMASDSTSEVVVPPTLQALLAARLDQLETAERGVLERGAIEGEVFHRGAVQALGPEEMHVTPRLAALVRKELIRPDTAHLAGEDSFRFRHLLIRDAAYEALPKLVRAELHERFAAWLESHTAELVEPDEIVGYHLEQACRYRGELGLPDDGILATEARRRLTAAGYRAQLRSDYVAAVSLLERASELVTDSEIDVALETDRIDALREAGKGGEALQRADSLVERAAAAGERVGELCGMIKAQELRSFFEPERATEKLSALLNQALPVFQAAGDDHALYTGYTALGHVANMRGRMDAMLEAFEQAAAHARLAGRPQEFLGWRASARFWGTTRVPDLLAWLDEEEARATRDVRLRQFRGPALAMLGRFDEARGLFAELRSEFAERGGGIALALLTGHASVDVELLAGDARAALELGEEGFRLFEELGETSYLSTVAARLGQALYALDRLEEADAWAGRAAELGSGDDALTQMLWRQIRAKVLARHGEPAEAERLAREAVTLCERTDMLDEQGDAYADLAEVLSLVGRPKLAAAALGQALRRYERKGNLVSTQRARERLAELQLTAPARS